MLECLALARRGAGYVSPNPMVGAVLVRHGRIVAKGYHRKFGGPHAEVDCLRNYRGPVESSTLYVNLEPCSHFGKTPPCTDLIIAKAIPRVVVGMKDPNPSVAGRGIRKLRSAGIRVEVGILRDESEGLNLHFIRHIVRRRPFVHVKIAQTLDGKIAGPDNTQLQISGPKSVALVHAWRSDHDAVLVGAETIRADNPLLSVRHATGRDPAVIILDGRLSLSGDERVFQSAKRRSVFLFCDETAARRKPRLVKKLSALRVEVVRMKGKRKRVAVSDVLDYLYWRNIGSVLVEGGSAIFGEFTRKRYCDQLSVFVAPRILGEGVAAFGRDYDRQFVLSALKKAETVKVGSDYLLHFTTRAK
jgi:diaminohydroxyphosphoribosylaminopyrimidine deaminase / 5-amino-6-(5-phosphoribosylamino)uracil reductase